MAGNYMKWLKVAELAGQCRKLLEISRNGWEGWILQEIAGNGNDNDDENNNYDGEKFIGWPYHSFDCVLLFHPVH